MVNRFYIIFAVVVLVTLSVFTFIDEVWINFLTFVGMMIFGFAFWCKVWENPNEKEEETIEWFEEIFK